MKKALYLHGFLGDPQDMLPLYLEGYDCESYDLRKILFEENYVEFLEKELGTYDFIVGYSFGGRILEELKEKCPHKADKWVFVSSRHTPYPEVELGSREVFKEKLFSKLDEGPAFFDYWRSLSLFGGHEMDKYRGNHKLGYTPWTFEQIEHYLEIFFTTAQFHPQKCKNSSFIHGLSDEKYSEEGRRLEGIFDVYSLKGGHRFLFENPERFKLMLKEII